VLLKEAEGESAHVVKPKSDLAGIRDAAALANLAADERKAFAQLWADVAALSVRRTAQCLGGPVGVHEPSRIDPGAAPYELTENGRPQVISAAGHSASCRPKRRVG
jgi:hypothetical protein